MATTKEYAEFVCEQIPHDYYVRYKKMFGEYIVYVEDKPIFLLCDNTVYVKILPQLDEIMVEAEKGYPYNGARLHYILDVEDRILTEEVIRILEPITPLPKKKHTFK